MKIISWSPDTTVLLINVNIMKNNNERAVVLCNEYLIKKICVNIKLIKVIQNSVNASDDVL